MGIAAPQIGIARAAAVVLPPDDASAVALLIRHEIDHLDGLPNGVESIPVEEYRQHGSGLTVARPRLLPSMESLPNVKGAPLHPREGVVDES
ncbi:hypothetical protein [Streptomyces sp. IMTB 2501]|uniref:hypothetical protein n=1 Tax=Streptomyces sp. IMTB 2501 TaxID=1776340 RepID=UPI0021164623|nr:hypothetical protein [Streptomyces sp. IMTB 2501]